MVLLVVIANTLAVVVGGAFAAAASAWLLWTLGKGLRHPEWGPALAFFALVVADILLGSSPFLQMALLFSALIAFTCWGEGRLWRKRHRDDRSHWTRRLSALWHRRLG